MKPKTVVSVSPCLLYDQMLYGLGLKSSKFLIFAYLLESKNFLIITLTWDTVILTSSGICCWVQHCKCKSRIFWLRVVDNDITDEEMFIELLEDNNQAELTPLERGKHASINAKKYSHDAKSVSRYAERIGEKQPNVSKNKSAYEVYKYCNEKESIPQGILLELSAKHFRLVHPAPQQYWVQLVELSIKNHLPTSEIEENVKGIKSIERDLQDFWLSTL